jgi:PKD repeat protein
MKLYIYIIILIFSANSYLYGQVCNNPPNCILNPLLDAPNEGPPPFPAPVPDWYYSHGSPDIYFNQGYNASNAFFMVSDGGGTNNEGIFACFNFKKNHTYKVCMWVKNNNGVQAGKLKIKATTGLIDGMGTSGTIIPTPTTSELISNSYTYSANWTLLQVNYTPNANFNQIWIYPFATGLGSYEVWVSNISIIEPVQPYSISVLCEGTITLDAPNCTTTEWYDPNGVLIGTGNVTLENATPEMSGTYTMYQGGISCGYSIPVEVTVGECKCESVQLDFDAGNISLDPNIYYPGIFSEISSGLGTTVGWYWDFGDGNTSTEQNPQHTYPYSNATYTVCLTIIRKIGGQTCCKKVCKEVTVNVGVGGEGELSAPITPAIGFKGDQLEEFPNAIHFTNITNNTNMFREYYWDFGDGTSSRNPNPNHIYKKRGSYEVCLRVKDTDYIAGKEKLEERTSKYCHHIKVIP